MEWSEHIIEISDSEEKIDQKQKANKENEEELEKITLKKLRSKWRFKKKKSPERDQIERMWMYGTEGVEGRLREVINEVLRGRTFPAEWRERPYAQSTKREVGEMNDNNDNDNKFRMNKK